MGETSDDSKYWKIYGQYYDLTNYMKHHAGGELAILQGKGRDCTVMFEQYHIMNDKHYKILDSFRVNPNDKSIYEIKLENKFHDDIKQMVRDHVKEHNTHHKMQPYMSIALSAVFMPLTLLSGYLWFKGYWISLFLLPFFQMTTAINSSHDAEHFAVSKYPLINRLVAYTVFPYEYNVLQWYLQHNVSHHPHTNLEDDVDLFHLSPFARLSKYEPYKWWHTIQYWHLINQLLFTTFGLSIFYPIGLIIHYFFPKFDFVYSHIKNKQYVIKYMLVESFLQVLASCALIVYPFYAFTLYKAICFSIIPWNVASIIFIFYTQIPHLQVEAHQQVDRNNWAINQVLTSTDHSQDYRIVSFLTGGVNMQSLHHLIPGVSSTLYYDLYPKYRKVCEKHGLKILEKKNFVDGFKGYLKWFSILTKEHAE
jgi:fatty acid desaturase